jgi:hypothetical protein
MDIWKKKFPAIFPGMVETMKVKKSEGKYFGVNKLTTRSVKI